MDKIAELKKTLVSEVEYTLDRPPVNLGGQSCGTPCYQKVKLTHKELDIEISIGYHRSQLKNKILATTLFELVLDDIIF
tara:strand:+ start:726 stop:962 length:237 start_codon:yes stop_codon:yes gene_type:complete